MVDSTTYPTPLGSPPQDVKQRILTEATRLFGEQGYDATSIQAVAEQAGVRKQSLLYHYPSKEVLRLAVIEAWLMHWRDELPKLLARSSGFDRFSASVASLLGFFREDPNRARLALREMLDRPGELQALMREHLSPWIKMLTDYIRLGQETGLIRREANAESYVVQVLLMVITTVAVGDAAAGIVGDRPTLDVNEMVRIARDALFVAPVDENKKG